MWKEYAVKTIYRLEVKGEPRNIDKYYIEASVLYEERIIVFKARSFDESIKKAEKEAIQHVTRFNNFSPQNRYGQSLILKYLNACDAYCLLTDKKSRKRVIYSNIFIFDSDCEIDDEDIIDFQLGPPCDKGRRIKFVPNLPKNVYPDYDY